MADSACVKVSILIFAPRCEQQLEFNSKSRYVANKISAGARELTYQTDMLREIFTEKLQRDVELEILLPPPAFLKKGNLPLLILNDGQDNEAVKIKATVEKLLSAGFIQPLVVVGVTAGDRMQEYGVSARKDYQGRGAKARAYVDFIVEELMPFLLHKYPIAAEPKHHAIAGYSLGGLSALDIAWNHPHLFSRIGVFSGSFWWRKRDTASRFYSDHRDRLMHYLIRKGKRKPGMKFWFQTGTKDETSDRNRNGIIDSIDDTLDLIVELTKKGYRPFHDISYLEVKDGEHNFKTWSKVMPNFLQWAFPAQMTAKE